MLNQMKDLSLKGYLKVKGWFSNEKGAMSLEWLGIAALLIMLVAVVSAYLGGDGKGTINEILGKILTKIKNQVGD